MGTAYVVTNGEYSNYSVDSVFLDKGLADEYVARRNEGARYSWDTYRIEEFPINTQAPKKEPRLTAVVQVRRDGIIKRLPEEVYEEWPSEQDPDSIRVSHLGAPPDDLIQLGVTAPPDVARKHAGEVAAQIAADFDFYVERIREGNVTDLNDHRKEA